MSLAQDTRYAIRTFRRSPGLVAAVVVSIGLGVAANATVFSMVNALLLGDLPVREPDRVVAFDAGRTYSWPDYLDYREGSRAVFEDVAAHFLLVPASIGGRGEPERTWGQLVTAQYFPVVGVPIALGRAISPEEDQRGGRNNVVVLSDGLWKRRFAADPNIVGQKVLLNGDAYEVVGVTVPGYHGTERGFIAEFWAPLAVCERMMPDFKPGELQTHRDAQWVTLHARLKPGVTRLQATAAVNVIKQRIDDTYRKNGHKRPPIRLTAAGGIAGEMEKPLTAVLSVLMTVVGLVLMIACANVANLLLARATARQREIGIRLATGASRGRLIRQLLTESILLAGLGAGFGVFLAYGTTRVLSRFEPPLPLPIAFDFTPDVRVLFFTAVLAVITGIVFGLAPALRATRPDLMTIIKQDSAALGSSRRLGLRNSLVVVQVALSLVLLVGATLFLRSLQNATSIDLGMRADNVLLLAFDPKLQQYSKEKTTQFLDQLRDRVTALPGVRTVSYLDSIPLSIGGTSFDLRVSDKADAKSANADIYNVGQNYFETLGVPLLHGREFIRLRDKNVAILNEKLAREMFGSENPIGRHISSREGPEKKSEYEVIGVARNSKSRTIGEEQHNVAYLFLENAPDQVMSFYGISLAVKTAGPPRQLESAVRSEIRKLDPNIPVFGVETMQEHVDKSMLLPRVCAVLLGVFGGVGLVLATVGLYGVISYSVRSRTREIGVRLALGAESRRVVRMVLQEGIALVAAGLLAGLALAFILGRFAASLLYGVSGTDTFTFIFVPLALVLVGTAAILIPARRASRVDPMHALRYE